MPHPVLVYSRRYDLRAGGLERLHPFDTRKYSRAVALLRSTLPPGALREPSEAARDDLLAVHPASYLDAIRTSGAIARAVEVPQLAALPARLLDLCILRPMRYATGGTVTAAALALETGIALNLGGGFHHASRDRAEGFCLYADIPIAIELLRRRGLARSVLYIDLDAHQGNGVGRVYLGDPTVAILDMYNGAIYPGDDEARRAIRWDLPLRPGTADREYLGLLRETLPGAIDVAKPDLAIYNAGTDVLAADPLGGLGLSEEGVLRRDRYVAETLTQRAVPWMMTTSGGYTEASHRLIAATVRGVFERYA